jgi:hypothetical protein
VTDFNDLIVDELERLLSMLKAHVAEANKWGNQDKIPALYWRHSAIENAIHAIRVRDQRSQ